MFKMPPGFFGAAFNKMRAEWYKQINWKTSYTVFKWNLEEIQMAKENIFIQKRIESKNKPRKKIFRKM